jgi:hypothetical protein
MAAPAEPAAGDLSQLPRALLQAILARLPVDCRLHCATVCRSWRGALDEPSLWLRLDLSAAGGVRPRHACDALLSAAVARADGKLQLLDATGCSRLSRAALLAAAAANGEALRELRLCGAPPLSLADAEALALAAPLLRTLLADACAFSAGDARRLLRNEPPFEPLRLRRLDVRGVYAHESVIEALAADLASHASLTRLELAASLHSPASLDAVVHAALARRLTHVGFCYCRLSFESAPALARLIAGGCLRELAIRGEHNQLLDGDAAALLGAALAENSSLTALTLRGIRLWSHPAAAALLLRALTGHASLRSLDIGFNQAEDAGDVIGDALGALVCADAPALTRLDAFDCQLGDAALGPLWDALPRNTHLRTLRCEAAPMCDAFAEERLLPAVRANASLRTLTLRLPPGAPTAARLALALVAGRAGAGA